MRNLFNDLKIPVNTVKFTSPFTCISHLLFDELNYSRKHDRSHGKHVQDCEHKEPNVRGGHRSEQLSP